MFGPQTTGVHDTWGRITPGKIRDPLPPGPAPPQGRYTSLRRGRGNQAFLSFSGGLVRPRQRPLSWERRTPADAAVPGMVAREHPRPCIVTRGPRQCRNRQRLHVVAQCGCPRFSDEQAVQMQVAGAQRAESPPQTPLRACKALAPRPHPQQSPPGSSEHDSWSRPQTAGPPHLSPIHSSALGALSLQCSLTRAG